MHMTLSTASDSGMQEVRIIDQSGQSGDCAVRVRLDDGRYIDVATDKEWRAVHVYDKDGDTIGWVTFDELFALASKNAG